MTIPKALKGYASQLGFPDSKNLARIFEILYDDEDSIKIIQASSKPQTIAELAKKIGLSENQIKEVAEKLMNRGALSHPLKRSDLIRRFPALIELRDATVLWPDAPQELFELWEDLINNELPKLLPILKELKIPPIVRVIPIECSVEAQNTVLDADSAKKIFKDAKIISVLPCACRTMARKNGRGQNCPAPEESVCMQTNAFAEAILNRGIGEKISNKDALRRIELAEKAGLVHMARNNIKEDMFMCNCCSCCCTGLFMVNQVGFLDGIARSRFRIKLNVDNCSGCGTCVDRCQFHAISVDNVASIDYERCFGCGNCAMSCPAEALALEEVRPLSYIRVT